MFNRLGFILLTILFLASTPAYLYSAVAVSSTVVVNASIPGTDSFSVQVKTISGNTVVPQVTWSDQIAGSGWQLANCYLELSVDCNYVHQIDIYTNNTTAYTGDQKGGLLSTSTTTVRVPLAWIVSNSTVTINNVGEPGELLNNTITGSTTTFNAPWIYLKDKNDVDDLNTLSWFEDWDSAYQSGYTTVMYGTATYEKLSYGLDVVSPFVLYLEGEFYYVQGNMRYESPIYFDLLYK